MIQTKQNGPCKLAFRHHYISEAEILKIQEEAVPEHTKKATKRDVGKTRDDRTSVTVKMGKTRDRTVRDIYMDP